jgi:chemotaxis protein MotB
MINKIRKSAVRQPKNAYKPFISFMLLAGLFNFQSCVPARQYDDIKGKSEKLESENSRLRAENLSYETKNKELSITNSDQKKRMEQLTGDTADMGLKARRMSEMYSRLEDSYDRLIKNNEKINADATLDNKKLLLMLENAQKDLIKKEDSLVKIEAMMMRKQDSINAMGNKLKEREARLLELEQILSKKDSTVKALKNSVSEALLGFENKGLTVTQKNGKVYVSLEEQLLFASGSTVIDQKGETALKQLAKVLEKNTDINVLIEGHTDNVPIKGGAIKDNWDLSVQRATSVVRIITEGSKINPVRLTAAGRSEYQPVDTGSTAEARKKNRRIEIILTPKLDELLQVLENN